MGRPEDAGEVDGGSSRPGRPFMPLQIFPQVMAEHGPGFADRMRREPPAVEVLETGTFNRRSGCVQCTRPGLLL